MSHLVRTGFAILLVGFVVSAQCFGQGIQTGVTRHEDIHVTELGLTSGGVIWSTDIAVPGATFLRIFFQNIRGKGLGSYRVSFVNSAGRPLFEVPRNEFERSSIFVTGELSGSFVEVQIIGVKRAPDSSLSFDISETGFSAQRPALLSSPAAGSDLQSINTFDSNDPIRAAAEAVARLSIGRLTADGLHRIYACTGFMISSDILVTNYHCIRDPEDCMKTVAYFVRRGDGGALIEKLERRCGQLIEAIFGLDIAIIRLRPPATLDALASSPFHLSISGREPAGGEALAIMGHPKGNELEVSKIDCRVKTITAPGLWVLRNTDFGHTCTTAEGSSGSPVLDKELRVLGLHHLGFDKSGRWEDENRAVKAVYFSESLQGIIDIDRAKQ